MLRSNNYDLVCIGGGYSSAMTLASLAENVQPACARQPRRVLVIDKTGNFPKGIAYDESWDSPALLTTTAQAMRPSDESGENDFIAWLKCKRSEVIDRLKQSRSGGIKAWLNAHEEKLKTGECAGLYLPRSVYGWFVEEKLASSFAKADGALKLDVKVQEARKVAPFPGRNDRFQVELDEGVLCTARNVLLAVGSLPSKSESNDDSLPPEYRNPQLAGLSAVEQALERELLKTSDRKRVFVAGSNASTADMLYLMRHNRGLLDIIDKIIVESPSAELPGADGESLSEAAEIYDFRCLGQLDLTHSQDKPLHLIEAALNDIEQAKCRGYTAHPLKTEVYKRIGRHLAEMSEPEVRDFAEKHGIKLTNAMRTTSPDYADAIKYLIESGKLELRKGVVTKIAKMEGEKYRVSQAAEGAADELYDAVLDCRGFTKSIHRDTGPLYESLLENRLIVPTQSGTGIRVEPSRYEASRGIFVIGPLLAGLVDEKKQGHWHFESSAKLAVIADTLGNQLAERMNNRASERPIAGR